MQLPSFTLIISGIFFAYILNGIYSIAQLFIAPKCNSESTGICLESYLTSKPPLQLLFYISTLSKPKGDDGTILVYNEEMFDFEKPDERDIALELPEKTLQNGTLYLHIVVIGLRKSRKPKTDLSWKNLKSDEEVSFGRIPLTEYMIPEAATFNLLKNKKKPILNLKPVAHLRSKVTFHIFSDPIKLPTVLPVELASLLTVTSKREFLPIVTYNFLHTRLQDLTEIKPSSKTMNITVSYSPMGIGRLRLIMQMQEAISQMMLLGFTKKDIDSIKEIFADTNLYILCTAILIGGVHLLFDILAFKNDISFWRNKKSLAGLSPRSVIWRSFSHAVIFLYLLDENTSLLVLVPSGLGTLIEFWKTTKVFKIRLVLGLPCIKFSLKANDEEEKLTQKHDAESMRYLSYVLYPLCIVGAIYSLVYQPHKSWYSWTIHSIANGVYAFGFLFMLPQLFVNYRLKSVAALPWRAFTYKAFNTFIDDVFAFIIKMPTSHRVACFRDDVVFLIYLYQRWLYPVDSNRIDEAALAFTSKKELTATKENKKSK